MNLNQLHVLEWFNVYDGGDECPNGKDTKGEINSTINLKGDVGLRLDICYPSRTNVEEVLDNDIISPSQTKVDQGLDDDIFSPLQTVVLMTADL